jgi:hypothetical protein
VALSQLGCQATKKPKTVPARVVNVPVGAPVFFASARYLISMKKHAGRDEDRPDVTALT